MSRVENFSKLYQIDAAIDARASQIVTQHEDWPCRRGCADCCRNLAAPPVVSAVEWQRIEAAMATLPDQVRHDIATRLDQLDAGSRPIVCPFLDLNSNACLIYEARPVRCRSYGFYAERDAVLGCHRIEAIAASGAPVIWGNHAAIESDLRQLPDTQPLSLFLRRQG